LEKHCRDARTVWNAALEQFNCWRRGRPQLPGSSDRDRQLADARQALDWLRDGSSVRQQALRDFQQAAGNFFAGTHGRPMWR
jgi:putative transposase